MNPYTDERLALREAVGDFLAKHCTEQQVRHDMEQPAGFDRATWSVFAEQLGLCGLGVPERLGGSGGDFLDVAVVAEQFGASLACLPFFSSVVLAQTALAAAKGADAGEYIEAITAGRLTGTVATGLTGTRDSGGWRLDGTADYVVDGATADIVVAFARTPGGMSQFVIDGRAPGLTRVPLQTMDQTRRLARLELAGVPARLAGGEGSEGRPVLELVRDTAAAALAVEAVGGMQRALDMSVEHAKTREQFGRKIGSFQAIKHRCADMFTDVQAARALAHAAAAARAGNQTRASVAASAAKAYCATAYQRTVRSMIQIHGGMGFTWEHPAHLYFKRATSDALLFGDPLYHRKRVAAALKLAEMAEMAEIEDR